MPLSGGTPDHAAVGAKRPTMPQIACAAAIRNCRRYRALSRVWCTLTANGHSFTIGNGFIRPLTRLDGPGLST